MRGTGGQIKRLLAGRLNSPIARVVGAGIGQRKFDRAGQRAGRTIADLDRNFHHVAFPQKAGHHWLDHQILGGHAGVAERAAAQKCVVGQAFKLPGSERVGEREFKRHNACLIGDQRRQKERCLGHVFAWRRRAGHLNRRWRWWIAGALLFASGLLLVAVARQAFTSFPLVIFSHAGLSQHPRPAWHAV